MERNESYMLTKMLEILKLGETVTKAMHRSGRKNAMLASERLKAKKKDNKQKGTS